MHQLQGVKTIIDRKIPAQRGLSASPSAFITKTITRSKKKKKSHLRFKSLHMSLSRRISYDVLRIQSMRGEVNIFSQGLSSTKLANVANNMQPEFRETRAYRSGGRGAVAKPHAFGYSHLRELLGS